MRNFSYRYEKILHLKSFIRKQRELEFSEIALIIEKMRGKILEYKEFLENPPQISDSSLDLEYRRYFDAIAAEIKFLENEIEKLTPEYNRRKEKYIAAKKEERILEKLKEKRYKSYITEYFKEESKILDEISTRKFYES
ncbi:MAG: flagellar export protein FliJ [Exilispira sp.]|jgi:flagellar FliJ protein|nr:flagellar export protein FliJ [Exilispira sp.]